MTTKFEELYLEAEADIRNHSYHDAFLKYESILYEEPDYAPAHNSMGWIFKTQFDNYDKAKMHFLAAIRSNPAYPHPYFHLAALYVDLENFTELKTHLQKCLTIPTIDKAWVYYRFGMLEETGAQYDSAIKNYRRAILHCFNNEKIKEYQADIERSKTKKAIKEEMGEG
jgi:tetratricopeptide (TPR) repeat protein